MTQIEEFWTPLGVRLRARRRLSGSLDWLFVPGGPGIGSESLTELADGLNLPGTSWLVDLPGDGSNVAAPGAPKNAYVLWPHVLLEAVATVANPICVGHATGGEYLLSIPELEHQLKGLVLISTAPDAGWMPIFEAMTDRYPLAEVTAAKERYEADPTDEHLCRLAVASAPWSFTPEGLGLGIDLLSRMPYSSQAVEWSAQHFDRTYVSAWWPAHVPTLIIGGSEDRIVTQRLWDDPYYGGDHVLRRTITGAGHFPWIEKPRDVKAAFGAFLLSLYSRDAAEA